MSGVGRGGFVTRTNSNDCTRCHLCSVIFLPKRTKDHLKGKHSLKGDDIITGSAIVRRSERNAILHEDLRKGQRITDDMIEHVLTGFLPALDAEGESPSVTVTEGVHVPIKWKGLVSKTLARHLTRTYRKRRPNLTRVLKEFTTYMRPLVKNPRR